jgi:serine/threonine protein phosphatase PrpC
LIRFKYDDGVPHMDATKFPHRVFDCGEDAFLTFHDPVENLTLLSVSDGVGGWTDRGIDSSVFSWMLMRRVLHLFQEDLGHLSRRHSRSGDDTQEQAPHSMVINATYPRNLLDRAYDEIVSKVGGKVIGSATVCLGVIDHRRDLLYVVNVGDSGFLVYRGYAASLSTKQQDGCRGGFVVKSQEQQHAFNFPYQLSPHLGRCMEADLPTSGMLYQVELLSNDIIFFASDGIFDNVFDTDLCRFFDDVMREKEGPLADGSSQSTQTSFRRTQRLRTLQLVQFAIQKGQDIRYFFAQSSSVAFRPSLDIDLLSR